VGSTVEVVQAAHIKGRSGGVYNLYEADMQPETIVDTLATIPEYTIYNSNARWTSPDSNSGSEG
jgi:hypothetical protein